MSEILAKMVGSCPITDFNPSLPQQMAMKKRHLKDHRNLDLSGFGHHFNFLEFFAQVDENVVFTNVEALTQ